MLDWILSLFTSKINVDIMTFSEGIRTVASSSTQIEFSNIVTVVASSLTGVT